MWGRFHLSQLFPSGFFFFTRASFPGNRAFAVFSSLLLTCSFTPCCQPATLALMTATCTRPAGHAEAPVTGEGALGKEFLCWIFTTLTISINQCLIEVSLILDALFNLTVWHECCQKDVQVLVYKLTRHGNKVSIIDTCGLHSLCYFFCLIFISCILHHIKVLTTKCFPFWFIQILKTSSLVHSCNLFCFWRAFYLLMTMVWCSKMSCIAKQTCSFNGEYGRNEFWSSGLSSRELLIEACVRC